MADDYLANPNTTGAIWVNGFVNGNLEATGDRDWFKVYLNAGVHYQMDMFGNNAGLGLTLRDPLLRLNDTFGRFIMANDDGGAALNARILFTPTVSGFYYLETTEFNEDETGTYRIEVRESAKQFSSPSFVYSGFSSAQGWGSQDLTPRHVADVNGDQLADIVGFHEGGTWVALNTGGGFGPASLKLANFGYGSSGGGWSSDNIFHREVIDVSGDGRADIVGFGSGGVWVAQATGSTGSFQPAQLRVANFGTDQGWSSQDRFPRQIADVNGDGYKDIVGFGDAGVYVALGQSGGTFGAAQFKLADFGATAGGWYSDAVYHRELADVNGDGRADIIGFGEAGVFVALATTGGNFAPAQLKLNAFGTSQGWDNDNVYHRELADVNGDFLADIVGFGAGGVYLSLATGNGNFAAPELVSTDLANSTGWTSQSALPRLLADLDGDRAADVIGFGGQGVWAAINGYHYDPIL